MAGHQKLKHKPCIHMQVYQSAAALLAGGPPERPARAPRRRGRRGDQVTQALDPQATMALGEWVFDSVWPSAGARGSRTGGPTHELWFHARQAQPCLGFVLYGLGRPFWGEAAHQFWVSTMRCDPAWDSRAYEGSRLGCAGEPHQTTSA